MFWSPDGQRLVFQETGEAYVGRVRSLDVATASAGRLWDVAPLLDLHIATGEYVGRVSLLQIDAGFFVQILCCRSGDEALPNGSPRGFGILTAAGMRRVPSPVGESEQVLAVDPAGLVAITYDPIKSTVSRVNLDGSNRTTIGNQRATIVF